eukprot:gene14673-biopygen8310
MFTNIDRAGCLTALRVFLDERWRYDRKGNALKLKLKRRSLLWVGAGSSSDRGAWSAVELYKTVRQALALACFRCGDSVKVQINGLPLGHHLSAALSRITVAYSEAREVERRAVPCACSRTHSLLVARWQDDTVFAQRVPRTTSVEEWKSELATIYPDSLELKWNANTGATDGVIWTDLIIDYAAGCIRIRPKEAVNATASDFKHVTPCRSMKWLWNSTTSIPQNHFMRLTDSGCRDWRVWETRAVLLLLAGYPARGVAYSAVGALWRRREREAARGLLMDWNRRGVLRTWKSDIRASCAGPNDPAFIHRAIAHRDALLRWEDRALWTQNAGGAPGVPPVRPSDSRASDVRSVCDARKRVGFVL